MDLILELSILVLGGLLAGSLGGMLGIGGGVLLMPLLRFVIGLPPTLAVGTCILAVFFTTLGGSYRHYKLGHVDLRSTMPIVISGAVATTIFSIAFVYLTADDNWLDLAVGLVLLLISIRMILESLPGSILKSELPGKSKEIRGSLPAKLAIGAGGGILPGLLGIGTGVILVPSFNFLLMVPIKTAVGSSLTCFCCNAFISSSFKLSQGFVDLGVALPICLGTFLGSNLGAILNKKFPPRSIKFIFGFAFTYVSLKFVFSFFGVSI